MDAVRGALNLTRPLVSPLLITDECFDVLVLELNLLHVECLKQTLSKVAGYAIVAFSSVLKVPLIVNIARSGSVDGLSTSSVYLETTMYAAMLVYHYFLGSPFSTYGEKYVLLAQNILISALIWRFGRKGWAFRVVSALALAGAIAAMCSVPAEARHWLVVYSTVGACASRLPQIAVNFSNGHTGVLSGVTLGAAVAGAAVRLLTVIQEVDDVFAVVGELLPMALNVVIFWQILFYRSATTAHFGKLKAE